MMPLARLVHDLAVSDDLDDEVVIKRARTRYVATSLVAALLLAGLAYFVVEQMAQRQAQADARARAAIVASVAGAWVEAVGDPSRRAELSSAIRAIATEQSVSQVIVWRADGQVAWAHDPGLVHQTYDLHEDLQALFTAAGTGSLMGRSEPVDLVSVGGGSDVEDHVEVFTATSGADGERLVVQSFVTRSSLADFRRETLWLLFPYVVTALVLVEGTCLVLCLLLVRQVRRGRQGRTRITAAAFECIEKERRAVARELHDGIVQDLAATRYALAAISDALPAGLEQNPKARLERIQEVLRDELLDLRGLLGDLLVPSAGETRSLEQALRAVVRHLVPLETRCHIDVRCPALAPAESQVVYRVVREGVSNAVQHAAAHEIRVLVSSQDGSTARSGLVVTVEDDGRGPEADEESESRDHFGLVLLTSLVQDQGGGLSFTGRDDGPGSRLVVTLPLRSLEPA